MYLERMAGMLKSFRPDFTNTEPATQIGPFPQWGDPRKIVAMDPWGHLAPWIFKEIMDKEQSMHVVFHNDYQLADVELVDLRPTIAITKAHMKASHSPVLTSHRLRLPRI